MKELKAAEKFCKEITLKFKKEVKSIWLLTSEKDKEATLTLLLDDLTITNAKKRAIVKESRLLDKKILKEDKVQLHIGFYELSKYFENIMKGNLIIFSEIRSSQPLYDPTGFFTPLKPLVAGGEIIGTQESLLRLINNVKGRIRKVDSLKLEILENLYIAVVSAGQAPLVAINHPVPVQKEVSKELRRHFIKDGMLSMDFIRMCDDVVKTFKEFEHKTKVDISGKELDELVKKGKAFILRMEHLVSKIHEGE